MTVASPWGPSLLDHMCNFLQTADHGFDRFPGDAPGAQHDRWGAGYVEHRRFEANAGWPCIKN